MVGEMEKNKEIVRGFLERGFVEAARGKPEALHEYFAPHYVLHTSRPYDHSSKGLEGLKEYAREVNRATGGDFKLTTDNAMAEGEFVAIRFKVEATHQGKLRLHHAGGDVEPTGKPVEISGLGLWRVENGKIVEGWVYDNVLAVMIETGAFAPRAQASPA